jgi:hypothetical protein
MEYISREAVNDLIEDIRNNHFILMSDRVTLLLLKSKVAEIPTADVQPVKRGRWITKAENYYKAWQDSGRSWDDMPYFVTGLKFACSNCFEQFDVNAEGVEKWNGCPLCLARMDGDTE